MPRLPVISGKDCVRALHEAGFIQKRMKGSHAILGHEDGRSVIVPMHRVLDRGTLKKGILNKIGMTVQEFMDLLGG